MLSLGLAVRLVLAPITSEADLETYAESSVSLLYGGSLYSYLIVYPPGWVLLLELIGRGTELFVPGFLILQADPQLLGINIAIGSLEPTALNVPLFSLFEKLPLFLFDALTAWLLYSIVREATGNDKQARFAFALWFLNPLVITVSAVHGGYDVIPAFLMLAAAYLLLEGRCLSSGVAVGLGFVLKLFPLFLVPILVGYLWRRKGSDKRAFLRDTGLLSLGIVAVTEVVFWPPGLLSTYMSVFSTGPRVGSAFGGFGVWAFLALPGLEGLRLWFYQHTFDVGISSFFLVTAIILWLSVRLAKTRRVDSITGQVSYEMIIGVMAILLLFSVVQPQYLLWMLPWLVLAAVFERRFRLVVGVITTAGTLFYFFGLAGPLYLFQPLALFTPWLSLSEVAASIAAWQPAGVWVRLLTTLPTSVLLLYATYQSVRHIRSLPRGTA